MTTSAIYALIHKLERDGGVWFPARWHQCAGRGDGAPFRAAWRHDAARRPCRGDRDDGRPVTGVRTRSGWSGPVRQVASNGDIVHSYDLLKNSRHGARAAQKLRRKRFSPSLFVVHFGVRGTFDYVPHHTILFGPRYRGLLDDIYDRGVLSSDFSLYLHIRR
jgi:phytoene desaturase